MAVLNEYLQDNYYNLLRRLSEKAAGVNGPDSIFMPYYVYLIRSIDLPAVTYVGYTTNMKERLATHNSGGSIHTQKNRPWELVMCSAFKNMDCAKQFEKYLKSQSGRAFAKKRFW